MWARTEEDKNKWVAAIREALGNVQPLAAAAASGDMPLTVTMNGKCCFSVSPLIFKGHKEYKSEKLESSPFC